MPALAPFTPGLTVILQVTGSTARQSLGTGGDQVRLLSVAANAILFFKFGDSTVTAAVTDTPLIPGEIEIFTIPPGTTHVAAIGTTSTNLYATRGDGA